jgi:putative redox protein
MIDIINTEWIGNMVLETDVEGHKIKMDTEEQFGGKNIGSRPKPLILSALSGCTGMDVLSILSKKRIPITAFNISVSGDLAEIHPKSYQKIHITYQLTGKNFAGNAEIYSHAERAVQLSLNTYCGIASMLKKASQLTYEIRLVNS